MDNLSAAWLYPMIIIAGVLQAWGPPMINPGLGSLMSFLPIVAFLGVVWMCLPRPMPTCSGFPQIRRPFPGRQFQIPGANPRRRA
jgi:transporter family-2 protein